MVNNKPGYNAVRHLIFIIVFLIVPILVSSRPPGEPFLTITPPFIRDIIGNILLLSFFYLNYFVLAPRLYFNNRHIAYVLVVLFSLAIIFVLPSLLTGRLHASGDGPAPPFKPRSIEGIPDTPGIGDFLFAELRHHFYLFFIALFFSFLLRTRENMAKMNEEKLKAELLSLKSQINPHFLFNTLNSIYALSVKKDSKASEAIINLSGLMRYVIKDADDNTITLEKEVEYISNYIELQKARLGNTASVIFDVSGSCGNKQIAPLILITYIENAFKYGVNPDVDGCIVEVNITVTDSGLKLYVFNKIVPVHASVDSTGIGIANTAERIKLLYPGRHHIEITENKARYSVNLSLELI